ncbi:hypothetical protein HanXRQr2_Chr04g0176231 [Helianthus annuus]|uniref:Uncharacterized protein n=1 Tax=Helianthus annuus TaxID=4232 RepID=A0A9K3NSL0_HELAN|nr:hypothetical protein HanXRQr2_Chr04g0176231 [Helianthus annuus]KAJ0597693.1 hypothetical protein HanHA89_Chr04g0157501 [Helianthus annuus]
MGCTLRFATFLSIVMLYSCIVVLYLYFIMRLILFYNFVGDRFRAYLNFSCYLFGFLFFLLTLC